MSKQLFLCLKVIFRLLKNFPDGLQQFHDMLICIKIFSKMAYIFLPHHKTQVSFQWNIFSEYPPLFWPFWHMSSTHIRMSITLINKIFKIIFITKITDFLFSHHKMQVRVHLEKREEQNLKFKIFFFFNLFLLNYGATDQL